MGTYDLSLSAVKAGFLDQRIYPQTEDIIFLTGIQNFPKFPGNFLGQQNIKVSKTVKIFNFI